MLEFKDLRAGYGKTERLHGVSARAVCGRLTAVIGPNGSGKSTLLKCAAGILKPSSGGILLNRKPMSAMTEKERARVLSYMPQSRLTPDITVRRLTALGRYPHRKWGENLSVADLEIIDSALSRSGCASLSERAVSSLSGGERQRAYLSMMLAQQTPVMLLDEPATHLDLSSQFDLMALLRSLCRQDGRCIVAVLHDLASAMEYADDLLLLSEGRLAAFGTPDEIYASGRIQDVFGVEIRRLPDGKYLFQPANQENLP